MYGPTSYLSFEITINTQDSKLNGDAMILFDEIKLKNGKELIRISRANVLSSITTNYRSTAAELNTVGVAAGYDQAIADGDTLRVCIPLDKVCPFFSNDQNLIPSYAIAGAQLQLTLASNAAAMTNAANAGATYSIANTYIMADLFDLIDAARGFMNTKASGPNGLIYTYPSFTHRSYAMDGTSLNVDVGESKGHVLYALSKLRLAADIDDKKNSMNSTAFAENTSWRYNLGGEYYPDQPITNNVEAYMMALQTFNKLRDKNGCSVTPAAFSATKAIMATSFERAHMQDLSGVTLATGGRRLNLEVAVPAAVAGTVLDTWVCFVSVVQAYADGKIIVAN